MKQLKNLLFVTLLAILAWNCQKEETSIPQDEAIEEGTDLKIEEIEFGSFRDEPFYNALNAHLEFDPSDGNASKGKKHNFKISRKHVRKVSRESGDHTSFTFYMTDDGLEDPTVLQNLVVVKRKGELEVYRFLYGGTERGTLPTDYDMALNTTVEKILDFDMDEMGSLTDKTPCLYDQINCPDGGGNNGTPYCYNVEVYMSYACSGDGATGTHYHDNDCNCTDGYGSCSSPYTDYQSEMFCTSESSTNGAAQQYVSENHLGGGGTDVSTDGNDILISSIVQNNIPDGADPLAFKIGLNSATPVYNWFINANNEVFYELVGEFLELNGSSVEIKEYAKKVIYAKMTKDFSSLYNLDVFNQNPYGVWNTLTQAEKDLIKNFPMQAYRIFKNRKIAENETIARFGYNGLNDKSDAFRHAFFNVINSKSVGQYYAKLFSDAHESEVPQHWAKEKQMDLFNNNVGHNSISGNSLKSENELANIIYQKLLNGDLRYLSPINLGDPNFAYTHGISNVTTLIPTDQ